MSSASRCRSSFRSASRSVSGSPAIELVERMPAISTSWLASKTYSICCSSSGSNDDRSNAPRHSPRNSVSHPAHRRSGSLPVEGRAHRHRCLVPMARARPREAPADRYRLGLGSPLRARAASRTSEMPLPRRSRTEHGTTDAEPEGSRRRLVAGMTRSASACASGLTMIEKSSTDHPTEGERFDTLQPEATDPWAASHRSPPQFSPPTSRRTARPVRTSSPTSAIVWSR
jgi:hypothetical protein